MESQDKMSFPSIIRQLRIDHGLKQREVAQIVDLKTNSYGNCEANKHKTMSLARVHRLARHYQLSPERVAGLVAAWEELPESEYVRRNKPGWERARARRGKLRQHDAMKLALVNITGLLVGMSADPGSLCSCTDGAEVDMFDDSSGQHCELCDALRLLGLPGWTNLEDVTARLLAVQQEMTG